MDTTTIEGIIFDLDGTLVNSIEDIADSMNFVLQQENYPQHSYAAHASFIGGGIRNLVSKAVPSGSTPEIIDRCFELMLTHYSENCTNKTALYEGIETLIELLYSKEIPMAVLSNKADVLTKKVVQKKLPNIFIQVKGMTTETLKKPNPEVVLKMCQDVEIDPKKTFYVGDTSVDIETAKNAGMISVAVTWGFRSKESLRMLNPDCIIDSPSELTNLI